MSHDESHAFLRELDQKLWADADKLRNNLDAAQYKHAVLGLIFLKYVSDGFVQRRQQIEADITNPDLRAVFVMANAPFNVSDCWDAMLATTCRMSLRYAH